MSRRVLTKITVDELIASGQTELQLGDGDIVTALAKEYAQQRGLRLVPNGNGAPRAATPGAAPTPDPALEPIPVAAIVRKAVIAAVGSEPAGLDAIIARVMKS